MEGLVKGDIVVIPFPFSDLSKSKRRPAFVAATLKENDVILCQITSKKRPDDYSSAISNADFKKGKLSVQSLIRTNKLFTADTGIVIYKAGSLKESKIAEVEKKLIAIFEQN